MANSIFTIWVFGLFVFISCGPLAPEIKVKTESKLETGITVRFETDLCDKVSAENQTECNERVVDLLDMLKNDGLNVEEF